MNQNKQQFEQALTQLRSGNERMAAELCELNLRQYPSDGNFLVLAAQANIGLQNFAIAKGYIEKAIRLFPDFPGAHETYGDLMLVQGRAKQALSAYETAMRLDPAKLSTHRKIDRAKDVLANGEAEPRRPAGGPRMRFDDEVRVAREHEKSGDPKTAEKIYRDILKKDPDHVEAARLLAGIAVSNKHFRDAEIYLKKVLSTAPDYTRAWVDLVNLQCDMLRFNDAVESARQVLRLAPDLSESHMVYAKATGMAGDHEEAIRAFQAAVLISPDKTGAICSMAHHQKTLGRQQEAIASYRRAIEVKPDHAEAYWSLANLKTFRFEDHEVAAMEALLERDDLSDEARAQLNNALGLEYEGRKDYGRAFSCFSECNRARRPHESYDPVNTESTHDRIIELIDREFIERNSRSPDHPVTPIFVVGLPRSGSTLIEQILASHSMVDGTHELGELTRSIQAFRKRNTQRLLFPDNLADCTADDWRRMGDDYLERTEIYRRGAPYFIDKNPNNFIFTGILKLAIPNAKIINARRHPLDSCLGSYKQLFASGQPFTYDMTELAEFYLQYQRLMDHWHGVLPGFVLDVRYEDVVADLETQVRRMLAFCGLPFEESCLRFHETERAVKTASSEQVRRPIYSSSVNLWRNYEPYLGELFHILEPLLEKLPAHDRPASPEISG